MKWLCLFSRSLPGLLFAMAAALPAAPIPGLFNTGVGTDAALLSAGSIDPHYRLSQSADASLPGPDAPP